MSYPTQRPWGISYKVSDAIICIGELEMNGDYYGGKLICESVEPSNAKLIVRAVNCHDDLIAVLKELIPMQGCVQCQELFAPCSPHGDINKTLEKARQFLSKAESEV